MELEEFAASGPYRQVVRIISALSTQDERIAEELRQRESGRKSGRGGILQFAGTIPAGLQMDFAEFAGSIETRIWESVGRLNWRPFEEAREFVRGLGLPDVKSWLSFCKTKQKPADIPSNPRDVYDKKGWESWNDWIGNGRISNSNREFYSYEKAREFVHALNLQSQKEWFEYSKSGKRPDFIPGNPHKVYSRDGEKFQFGDWLGTGRKATFNQKFLPYHEAKKIVHSLQIKNQQEWRQYCKEDKLPFNIPKKPEKVYAEKGKKFNFGEWLGTENWKKQKINLLIFSEARDFVRSLKLKNGKEWKIYCQSGKKPDNIPNDPKSKYLNFGWKGMPDWLGNNRTYERKSQYSSFEDARLYVQQLNLKNSYEWKAYCKSGKKPKNIPANPRVVYSKLGWKGFGDWLGTGIIAVSRKKFLPFPEAKKFVKNLNLRTSADWINYCKSGLRPQNIPSNPNYSYKDIGWQGWRDWLGKE
jgi:hypothetical protein